MTPEHSTSFKEFVMRKSLALLCALLLVLLIPLAAPAQPAIGDYEITLSGSGTAAKDFGDGAFGASIGVGKFIEPNVELGVRQSLAYVSDGALWFASTRFALDLHVTLGKAQPFVGASIGLDYGTDAKTVWSFAPEAGLKWYLAGGGRAFLYASIAYDIVFDSDIDNRFVFNLGVGFNLP
jgi:hypothetical protein